MEWWRKSVCVILLIVGLAVARAQWSGLKKIKESRLEVLTFQEGKYTTARRTVPIPQLRCVSGCSQTPKSVQCYNRGWDGQGNNWECKATLPAGVSFGKMDVNCEGYEYEDDPYITVGSCSLKYELTGQAPYQGWSKNKYHEEGKAEIFNIIFYVVIFTVVVVLFKCCMRSMRDGLSTGDDAGPGGPGSQGYYGTGGPPPGGPGFRPEYFSSGDGCGGTRRMGPSDGEGPGFWSGMMAGGLLGYIFGNRGDAYGYGGDYDYIRPRRRPYPDADTFTRDRQSSSNWTSSSEARETTGYATSSRR
ncbi:store-operated calcium entry-associated regulatory factor-like [Tropilaelaps mercedesae]|uniref:Store-operated calcium entry-associated regulatory factor n=1 Tax=Tropilaelaps mercedesae TaxID=418985 RepID=A0A1V9XJR3_9ACAR|nr:store-operated calcium entry-associated regulatory factor-like [Tropilaelaps mercedesae]